MSTPDEASEEARREVRVTNDAGLHARPCHALVSLAREYDCEFRVACGGREVNGRSILELMTLGASVGSLLGFHAKGVGAAELVDRATRLVAGRFDETS